MRDDEGQSPLDIALRGGCVDVALYLMSRGCGGDEDKAKLLCEACRWGKLGVVKELVEQYKVDPKSESSNVRPVEDTSAYRMGGVVFYFGFFRGNTKIRIIKGFGALRSHT